MPRVDTAYRHWTGRHQKLWWRRWVISEHGIRSSLANRWMRYLLVVCWVTALVEVAALFCVGQLLVADSLIVRLIPNTDAAIQAFVRGLTGWLEQHPEVSVRTTQNLLFYQFATFLLTFNLIVITLTIPRLVTRDLSSHAIVIYASKAVSRLDYVIGKLGIVLGLLTLTWLGPVVAAWFLGNLLAPDWHFFWHARAALGHALLFVGLGMLFLGLLALAVSAVSARSRATIGLWLILWLVGNAFVPFAEHSRPWLRHLSFRYNLDQAAVAIFQPKEDLQRAQTQIPILGDIVRRMTRHGPRGWQTDDARAAFLALGLLVFASGLALGARIQQE